MGQQTLSSFKRFIYLLKHLLIPIYVIDVVYLTAMNSYFSTILHVFMASNVIQFLAALSLMQRRAKKRKKHTFTSKQTVLITSAFTGGVNPQACRTEPNRAVVGTTYYLLDGIRLRDAFAGITRAVRCTLGSIFHHHRSR